MTDAPPRPGSLPVLVLLLLGAVVLGFPTLWNEPGFVDAVDAPWRNPIPVGEAGGSPTILRAAGSEELAPLAVLSFWFDRQLAGVEPSATGRLASILHLHSIAIHVLAAIALLFLLCRTGLTRWRGTAAAAVFLLHPATWETAVLIGYRPALLAGLFGFLALSAASRPGPWAAGIAALAAVLAVGSSPLAVVLPLLGLAVGQAIHRREDRAAARSAPGIAGVLALPTLVALVVVLAIGGGVPAFDAGRMADPLLGTLWPRSPGFVFAGEQGVALGVGVLAGLAGLALALSRLHPPSASAVAWVAVGCLAAGWWTPGTADLARYLVVAGAGWLIAGLPLPGRVSVVAAAAVVLVCAVVDLARAPRMQDGEKLWRAAAADHPVAAVHLAGVLAASSLDDQRREAITHLRRALPELPDGVRKLSGSETLSRVLSRVGRLAEASTAAEEACVLAERLHGSGNAHAGVDDGWLLQTYLRAVECFSVEDSRAKIDHYMERARALTPGHPEVLAGEAERAFVALVHAVRRETGNPDIDVQPGWIEAGEPRLVPIRALLESALRTDPSCYRALILSGRITEATGGVLSAVPLYQRAIEARPRRAEARVLLATLYVAGEDAESAELCVKKAFQDGVDDPSLHYLLANIYAIQGRREDARRHLEAYLENRPGNRPAKVLLANLLASEAISQADRLDVPGLRKYADRIQELNPDDPKGWLVRATLMCKERPRRYLEAIVLLEKAQRSMPNHRDIQRQLAEAHRDLGWSLVLQDRRELAMDHFQTFLSLAPPGVGTEAVRNAVEAFCESLERTGRTRMLEGEAGAAEVSFRRSTELVPGRPKAFFQLGVACFHQKKLAQARAAFEQAIDLRRRAKENIGAYLPPLLDVLERSGESEEAKRLAEAFLAAPGSADAETIAQIRAMVK